MEDKVTIVRLSIGQDKFEIMVKPDPALDFKNGKKTDVENIMISDEIYSDANKGSRASNEKLLKYFKTTNSMEIAEQILIKGDLSLNTDQRRKLVEEKKKQISQYINKSFVDPRSHLPHPITRIEAAMNEARVTIDPFKQVDEQTKTIIDSLRKILPLKSEMLELIVRVPPEYSAQSYNVFKHMGEFKSEQWLSDGSLQVVVMINAGIKGIFLEKIGGATKGAAQVTEK